ncbi:MAG: chloramphenicol phosphotransferase [Xanthobacteraceae bacterium]
MIDADGVTPLPHAVWDQVDNVQQAVMETIATLAPLHASFIFTDCAFEGDDGDRKSYELMRTTAERRKALFVPIRILCSEEEVARRTVSHGRKEQLKSIDAVDGARLVRTRAILDPHHENQMTLDISTLSAEESARGIARHIEAVGSRPS